MNYEQIAILFLQGALVSFVILLLFKLRKKLGIGMLFACLGLFQFMQVFLARTVYVSVLDHFLVSPGSVVLFTATLFAILILYIKEDAGETRKLIYALIIVNVIMSILLESFSWNLNGAMTYNPVNVSTQLFSSSAWVLFVGTVSLFLDAILMIIIYEFISRRLNSIFLQIFLTMLIVVSFDTVFFSLVAFWSADNLNEILVSGLISKSVFTVFYSVIFYVYLKYFEVGSKASKLFKVNDVFHMLSYKQKFETVKMDMKKASDEIEKKDMQYQTLTDIATVGIFQTREDGYTTFVNKRWCEITGIPMDRALGWEWIHNVHVEDRDALKAEWASAVDNQRKSEISYRFVLTDNSIKWVLGQAVPEYDLHKKLIGFVGTITDITELKIVQQEQVVLREKADESNRLKSAFLANMSHEIRTPMNGILGFAGLLKDPNISAESLQEYIKIISLSGMRMLNLLSNIVNLSKIESGNVEVHNNGLDINKELDYLYSFFKPEVDARSIIFSSKFPKGLEQAIVSTDKSKFISIFSNLIKNAIKYTVKGSIEFGYTIKGDFYEFYVIDSGVGIALDKQETIFESFVQADADGSVVDKQGVGLGLSISKAYVETLGGTIRVESDLDKGSAFYFTIPCPVGSNNSKASEITAARVIPENKAKELKVLIVEDDEISNLLIDELLTDINCSVIHAENGAEAIEVCQNNPDLDLILMDIKMPIMDGYEATRRIREFNKDVIIVAQTAHALTGDMEKSLGAGCDEYISKPISKERITSIFQNYFHI